jgi:hypothetical protein
VGNGNGGSVETESRGNTSKSDNRELHCLNN